ncbi:hypothetical protein [Catenulispora rubra]|uniref:hypothetical protein n=1 Tax=Catenulispora rubra TaxID=280293 RepID=UPI0018921AE9|nr:hypothetical protein [Catenulispora rubra]
MTWHHGIRPGLRRPIPQISGVWLPVRHSDSILPKKIESPDQTRSGSWRRRTATAALRSLFFFAKKNKLIFANPTTRLKAEPVNDGLVPMSQEQIRLVENAAVRADQRLAVILAAVQAAKRGAIRDLTLDDLDLANRRITIAGSEQRLSKPARQALLAWLDERRSRWPHNPNRHVLINTRTALGDGPVSSH